MKKYKQFSIKEFSQENNRDINELFNILSNSIETNKYKINDKEKLFKKILEYIYLTSYNFDNV